MRILVRRTGALGDVVLATPIIRRLRREHPDAEIAVQTGYADVFKNSPHKVSVYPPGLLPYPFTAAGGLDRLVELDGAYEAKPYTHIVNAYMLAAFGDEGDPADRQQELAFKPEKPFSSRRPVVAVHAAKAGWRNRTLPEATWMRVIDLLSERGFTPLLAGSPRDALPKSDCASFHYTDILRQASVIASCACFVGSDSGLLHVAGATNVPIVGVFTSVSGGLRLPWRHGCTTWLTEEVVPPIDCIGCHHSQPAPATLESCARGDVACVGLVSAEAIAEAVVRLVG